MKFLFIFFLFIYFLAPVITYSSPYKVKVYDLINSSIKLNIVWEARGGPIVVYPTSGYPIQLYQKPGAIVPAGQYRYFPVQFSEFYQGEVLGSSTWNIRAIQIGSRILLYLFIAYEFYSILDYYLQKYNEYNALYESFVDRNPGIAQGSFLCLKSPFFPYVRDWRLAIQANTVWFENQKNKNIRVYDDQEVNDIIRFYMVGIPTYSFLQTNFTEEYMNTLQAERRSRQQVGMYIIEAGSQFEYFGLSSSGYPVSEARIAFSMGYIINEYLSNNPNINTFQNYLNQLQNEANQKAIREIPPTSGGLGGKEIIGYYFPGAVDDQGEEVLPEGLVVPLGVNEDFERDLEENMELCECPSAINLDVEAPPDVESQIPVDSWTSFLDDLKNRFPFSLPYTYTYLISLMTIYTYSNIDIVNDIENLLKQYFLSAGYNININLDYIAPFIGFIRTLGTVLIILLVVVGYRRLLI